MRVVARCMSLALTGTMALLLACGRDSPTRPHSLRKPVPGVLIVRLSTPYPDDAALLVRLIGPVAGSDVSAAEPGTVLHFRQRGDTTTVALFGPIASGALLRLSVPDVGDVATYTARIIEVADDGNVLRPDLSGYGVTVEQ